MNEIKYKSLLVYFFVNNFHLLNSLKVKINSYDKQIILHTYCKS